MSLVGVVPNSMLHDYFSRGNPKIFLGRANITCIGYPKRLLFKNSSKLLDIQIDEGPSLHPSFFTQVPTLQCRLSKALRAA